MGTTDYIRTYMEDMATVLSTAGPPTAIYCTSQLPHPLPLVPTSLDTLLRLGATGTNLHVPTTIYICGRHIQRSNINHAMSCNRLSSAARIGTNAGRKLSAASLLALAVMRILG
jgi:hypothetical protein